MSAMLTSRRTIRDALPVALALALAAASLTSAQEKTLTPQKRGQVEKTISDFRYAHSVPGISGANSLVGPPLTHFAQRGYIAGMLRNTPDNLVQWIRDPQKIVPGNAMPALGIDNRDAHDIAAYLYTLD